MTFSIIMPVYGVERYLEQSIRSVLGQQFRDFELILVHDASPDRCGEICRSFAERDGRVRLIHNQRNVGVCESRNAGIRLARGEWIWFVDPDDRIAPQALEQLYRYLSPERDVLFFGFRYVQEREDGTCRPAHRSMPVPTADRSNRAIAELVLKNDSRHTFSPVWNKLYRRSLLERHAVFFQNTALEDVFFNLNVFSHTDRIQTIAECLYFYLRRRSGSLSKQREWNRANYYRIRRREMLRFLRQKGAETGLNRARVYSGYLSRLFYVLYVAVFAQAEDR